MHNDTITALATGVGGAIAIVRLSGADAVRIADLVWKGRQPLAELPPRQLCLGAVRSTDDAVIDSQTLAVRMPAPHSYSGEDMVELQCHGGQLTARLLLQQLFSHGARHAEPGEFTRRAFLNGKMDLTQAEAVADLIQAHSSMALHLANRQLNGQLGRRIDALDADLQFLIAEFESRLDFPDEHLDWLCPAAAEQRLQSAIAQLSTLIDSQHDGEILRNGIRVVLAGPPNAGKSSLMNTILGRDRAIVTAIAGTTRDTLEELAHVRGIPVRVIDTAGIREASDIIERSGIERSLASVREAQILLWIFDAADALPPLPPLLPEQLCRNRIGLIPVANKLDLLTAPPPTLPSALNNAVYISALTGAGIDQLYDRIEQQVWQRPHDHEPEVAVSARHAALLQDALTQLADTGITLQHEQWELAVVTLRAALRAIAQVTGKVATPDVLDHIFARFCIGK